MLLVQDKFVHKVFRYMSKMYSNDSKKEIYTMYSMFIYLVLAFYVPLSLFIEALIGGISSWGAILFLWF